MGPDWLAAAVRATNASAHHRLYVGCENEKPLSLVSVSLSDNGARAVASLIVAPERRRTGAGRATIEALLAAFPSVEEFSAYVDPRNTPSLRLMKNLGLLQAAHEHPGRVMFVWRRDGAPPADDWRPPNIPLGR